MSNSAPEAKVTRRTYVRDQRHISNLENIIMSCSFEISAMRYQVSERGLGPAQPTEHR